MDMYAKFRRVYFLGRLSPMAMTLLERSNPHMLTRRAISAKFWVLSVGLVFNVAAKAADVPGNAEETPGKIEYKLTPSYYQSSDGNDAVDVNLRASGGRHTAWLGQYHDRAGFEQARGGYEYRQDFEQLRVIWSAQLASRGFLGGSATAEIGGDTFGIVGFGRTNLRDYYNLNFDPNDAITIGIGSRAIPHTELSLFHIWDDRLDTRQHVTHLVLRYKPTDSQRLTIDTSYKHGLTNDDVFVKGYGLSATYDYRQYFARVARDEYANFTGNHLTRFSLGMRF